MVSLFDVKFVTYLKTGDYLPNGDRILVCKVRVMQNFSRFYFSLKITSLDPVFYADQEYDLTFLIW